MKGYKPNNSEGLICYCKKNNKYYIVGNKTKFNNYVCLECSKKGEIYFPPNTEIINGTDLVLYINIDSSSIDFKEDDMVNLYSVINFLTILQEAVKQSKDGTISLPMTTDSIEEVKNIIQDILLKISNCRNLNIIKYMKTKLKSKESEQG